MSDENDAVFQVVRLMLRERGWIRQRNLLWFFERWRDPKTLRVHSLMRAIEIDGNRRRVEQVEARIKAGRP